MAALNLRVAVVTFEEDLFARAYVEDTGLPWPMLVDHERRLYRAYGMERGKWRHLIGPATIVTYLQLLFHGRKLKRARADVKQLGGDVLIDPDGIVRFHHIGNGPADRPPVEALLDIIQQSQQDASIK